MPSLDLRTIVANNRQTCAPPSLRSFATEALALADSPRAGDLYSIGGSEYWYDGATFQPVGRGDRIEVPDTAFADPDNPTVAEVNAYVLANFPDYTPGTLITFDAGGDYDSPDWVWVQDSATVTTAIETPAGSTPVAVIDLHDEQGNFVIHSGGHSSHVRTVGRTITNYEWTVSELGGGVLASISGAPDDDASSEFGVIDGTYEHPTWDTLDLCGDVEFCLQVTDSAGDVSNVTCEVIHDYGLVNLYFDVEGGSTFVADTVYTDGYVTEWDLGDGTVLTSNAVNHAYAAGQTFSATATVCLPTLQEIEVDNSGVITSFQNIFADADVCDFPNLEMLSMSGNAIGGSHPNLSSCKSLTDFVMFGNNLSGSIPGVYPPTLVNLSMARNSMSGSFPDLSSAVSLELINIERNNFTGDAPTMPNSPNLQSYFATLNQFSGGFPDLTANPNLQFLYLSTNDLSGEVPSLNANPALIEINIASNDFSGQMPDMTNHLDLELYTTLGNRFSGRTPILNSTALTIYNIAQQDASFGGMDELPQDPNQWSATIVDYKVIGNGYDGTYTDPVGINFDTWRGGGATNEVGGTYAFPDFTGAPNMTEIRLTGQSNTNFTYTAGSLSSNSALAIVRLLINCTPLEMDDILCDIDASGATGGTLNVSGNAPPVVPTAVGIACAANLVGKGWTVQTD